VGGAVYYTPNLLNYHGSADYWEINAKYVLASNYFPKDWGAYISGAYGYWHVAGGTQPTVNGVLATNPIPSYSTWNAGLAFTYKVFTLDLRYSDTDLGKNGGPGSCAAFWNGGTLTNGWCRASFAAKLSFDLLANTNLK